jgi:hypothetical protein
MSDFVMLFTDPKEAFLQGYDQAKTKDADTITRLTAEIEQNRIDLEEYRRDVERLRAVVEAADKLRNGIRAAGVKRMPELYLVVMAFDAARAALSGDK